MSVYPIKRKSGRSWRIDFCYIDPVTGAKKRHRRTFKDLKTREEAKKKELELMETLTAHPTHIESELKSSGFEDFTCHWLTLRGPDMKPSTYRSYESIIRTSLVPFFGNRDLRSIGSEWVQSYKSKQFDILRPKTINNHLGVLSSLMASAIKWKYAEDNPVAEVGLFDLSETIESYNYLNEDEARRFLEVAETHRPRWAPLFGVALNTGLRQGELAALKWQDIDFDNRQLRIYRSMSDGVETIPKGKKYRTVALNKKALAYLERQRHQKDDTDYVFECDKGRRLNSNRIKRAFTFCKTRAGVEKIRFHDLRHTFASHMVSRGASLYKVQKALGHKTLAMTARYAHLQTSDLHEAVALLDD